MWKVVDLLGDTKVLIVYYSRTGVTECAVQYLKELIPCDIEKIIDVNKKTTAINYIRAVKEATACKATPISAVKYNPADYDLIIIGTPVWSAHIPPAIRTYLKRYKSKIKNIGLLITQNSKGGDRVILSIEKLLDKKALGSLILNDNDFKKGKYEDKISVFLKKFKKL